jgi:hypothetical protein
MPGASSAGSCLLRISGGVCAAVVAAAQRHSMHQFSACSAGLQPSEPKKYAEAGLILGKKGLAGLGWMGKQGMAFESGCCRSTGRVPVMKQF